MSTPFPLGVGKDDYYVTASRLVPYKRVDLIVDAFSNLPDRNLVVIGDGPEFPKIAARAGPNVKLLGYQPQENLRQYLQRAKAFLFAADEDFGISPVEAQACGTPVIAYGVGGRKRNRDGRKTGIFFSEQTPESLAAAVREFEDRCHEFDPQVIRGQTERFRPERFRHEFEALVGSAWNRFCAGKNLETGD